MLLFLTSFWVKFRDDLDDAADLIYFLGFLSTLGTIASVLLVEMNENSKPYVFSFFGIGLILTGVAIILRMSIIRFFGITDPEQDVLDNIDLVSKNLVSFANNIENSISSFNQAHTQISTTLVSIGQDYTNLRSHMKNTTSSIATAMDGLFESIETSFDSIDLDQLKLKINDFVRSIDQAYPSGTIEGISASLGVLNASLKSTSSLLESLDLALRESINSIPTRLSKTEEGVSNSFGVLNATIKSTSLSLETLEQVLRESISSIPSRFDVINFEETMKSIKQQLNDSTQLFASSLSNENLTDNIAKEIEESVLRFTRSLDIKIPAEELRNEIYKIKNTLAELADSQKIALENFSLPASQVLLEKPIETGPNELTLIDRKLSDILITLSKIMNKYLSDKPDNNHNSSKNLPESGSKYAELSDNMLNRLNDISSQLSEINSAIRAFSIRDNTHVEIKKQSWFGRYFSRYFGSN